MVVYFLAPDGDEVRIMTAIAINLGTGGLTLKQLVNGAGCMFRVNREHVGNKQ